MRYRLWQRLRPTPENFVSFLGDDHELFFEWLFWTLEEALAHAQFVKDQLKGCLGEYATYYQIYDTCTYAYYAGEGFSEQNEKQRREDPLGEAASARTQACLREMVLSNG